MQAVGQGLLSSVGRIASRPARQIRWNAAIGAATAAVTKRRLTEASANLLEALDIARTEWPDSPRLAESLVRLADLLAALEQPLAALPLYRETVLLLDELPDGIDTLLAHAVSNMGRVLMLTDQPDKAAELVSAAIALQGQLGLPGTPALHFNRAVVLAATGRDDEAGAAFENAVAAMERGAGPRDMLAIAIHDNYALFCLSRDRSADAEHLMRQCLILRQEAVGPRHPAFADGLMSLARLQLDGAAGDEAESLLWQAADICERAGKTPASGLVSALYYLARIAHGSGRLQDVEASCKRIAEFGEIRHAAHAAVEASTTHLQALMQQDDGHAQDPEPLFRRTLQCAASLDGPYRRLGHEITIDALGDLASLLAARNKTAEAERMAVRAGELARTPLWAVGRQVISSIC